MCLTTKGKIGSQHWLPLVLLYSQQKLFGSWFDFWLRIYVHSHVPLCNIHLKKADKSHVLKIYWLKMMNN